MRKTEMCLITIILLVLSFLLCGCNEVQNTTNQPRLIDQLVLLDNTQAGRKWKAAFGDNIETRQSFNLMLLNDAYSKFNNRITALEVKDPNE